MARARGSIVNAALSKRQREIANLIVSGNSTREIAEMLIVSPRTVETHISAIFEKLAVRTRVELTALLIRSANAEPLAGNAKSALPSLIGRDEDVASIRAMLEMSSVVSIVGTGGVGKTQTSLRVGEAMRERFSDGLHAFELGTFTNGEQIVASIAQAFGFTLAENDGLNSLKRQLSRKKALLLLDNCEHLADDVGAVVAAIVKACHDVRVLATSRQPLRIASERVYRLAALRVPEDETASKGLRVSDARDSGAVELFVERARAVDDRFAVTDANMPAIGEICRRLDGVPLAIELAAARVTHFAPAQILDAIRERLELLRNAGSAGPSRHRSMTALIDWSYDDLEDGDRVLFRRLGIFAGSFSLEGALRVAAASETEERYVVERLASLIDKSLVMVDRADDAFRYRLLETTRIYALEKLATAGEREATGARHLRYLADRFAAMRRASNGWSSFDLLRTLKIELSEVRAALDYGFARADFDAGARLLAAIGHQWISLGLEREGIARQISYVDALAGRPSSYPMMFGFIELLFRTGRGQQGAERARRSLAAARALGDPAAIAIALQLVAATESHVEHVRELMREAETIGHRSEEAEIWYAIRLTWIDLRMERYERCEAGLKALYARSRLACDDIMASSMLSRMAAVRYRQNDIAAAIAYMDESVRLGRALGSFSNYALTLYRKAQFLTLAGMLEQAGNALREVLSIAVTIDPESANIALYLEGIAFVAAEKSDLPLAALLAAFANPIIAREHFGPMEQLNRLRSIFDERLASALPPEEYAALCRRGKLLSLREAIELALA